VNRCLVDWRQPGRLPWSRESVELRLRGKRRLLWCWREGGSWCNGRVLRWLCTGLSVFPVTIHICIICRPIQTHAPKLYSSPINSVLAWHDHCFLLFQDLALIACRPSRYPRHTCRFVCACCKATKRWSCSLRLLRRSDALGIRSACYRAGCGRRRRWARDIENLLEIRFRQIVF